MKRTRDPETTKKAILKAAETIFLAKGFGAAAIREIAHKAGVTKSLVHHYFGSKKGLWQEVKLRRMAQYAQEQMDILQTGAASEDLFTASLEGYFRFLQHTPQLTRIMAWMFLEQDPDKSMEMDRELIRAGVQKIREGQEKGLLRDDIDARLLMFMFIGLTHQWFQGRDHFINDFGAECLPDDLDGVMLDAIKKLFFEGVLRK